MASSKDYLDFILEQISKAITMKNNIREHHESCCYQSFHFDKGI